MWKFFVKMIGTTCEFLTEFNTIERAISNIEDLQILGFEAFFESGKEVLK